MDILRKDKPLIAVIIGTLLITLWLAFNSISHSFWTDEALISSFARDIVLKKRSIGDALAITQYQPLQVLITTLSFSILGPSEWSARLPTLFFGIWLVVGSYKLTSQLTTRWGGLLSALILSLSSLQLAHMTQAKSAVAIEVGIIWMLFFLSRTNNKKYLQNLFISGTIGIVLSLLHPLGLISFALLLPYIVYYFKKIADQKKILTLLLGITASLLLILGAYVVKSSSVQEYVLLIFSYKNNYMSYILLLFFKQYLFYTIPAIIGWIMLYKKHTLLALGTLLYAILLLYLWAFVIYSHNIRYIMPLIAILFVLTGYAWGEAGKQILPHKPWVIPLLIAIILYSLGYRIVRTLPHYANPNLDLIDVQNANYRDAFLFVKSTYDLNESGFAIFNDVPDAQVWYLPERQSDAYFKKTITAPKPNSLDGVMQYKSLNDFLREKSKYKKGVLIIEDWQSFLPETIKKYAKKNMKLEYRVEGLDPNPYNSALEVRSWGMP